MDPSGLSKTTQPEIKLGLKGAGNVDPGFTGYDMSRSLRINEILRKIKNHFDQDNDGELTASDCPPFRIRLVGYSWGGWSALGVVDKLSSASWIDNPNNNLKVAVGTLDPVNTLRIRGGLGAGGMPSFVRGSINIYQTNGCPGFGDCPGPSSWYKGESVPSATINNDVTASGLDHVTIKIYTNRILNYVNGVNLN